MNHSEHLAMNHDTVLVVISWLVAIFAAYAAVSTINKLQESRTNRQAWLWGGATAFGFGVWAMHFTAMTALQLGVIVTYDLAVTLLSVVFAVLGAYLSFGVITQGRPTFLRILGSGFLLGSGVGAMHYTGMAAMRMNAALGYDLTMLGVSVVVAVTISSFGLWLMTNQRLAGLRGRNLLVAGVVGSAIPFMHYAGMAAAQFSPHVGSATTLQSQGTALSLNLLLVVAIVVVSFPMFLGSLLASSDETLHLQSAED